MPTAVPQPRPLTTHGRATLTLSTYDAHLALTTPRTAGWLTVDDITWRGYTASRTPSRDDL